MLLNFNLILELIFIGDANDAFWLAQAYFLAGHYLRAERLLTDPLPPAAIPQIDGIYTGLSSKGKGKEKEIGGYEGDIGDMGEGDEDDDMFEGGDGVGEKFGSGHEPDVEVVGRGRLIDESLACRYLAAQCLVSLSFDLAQFAGFTVGLWSKERISGFFLKGCKDYS